MFDFILQKHAFKKQLKATNQWRHCLLSSDDYSILWYNKLKIKQHFQEKPTLIYKNRNVYVDSNSIECHDKNY